MEERIKNIERWIRHLDERQKMLDEQMCELKSKLTGYIKELVERINSNTASKEWVLKVTQQLDNELRKDHNKISPFRKLPLASHTLTEQPKKIGFTL